MIMKANIVPTIKSLQDTFSEKENNYLTCAQKLTGTQFSLMHEIETKRITKIKLKTLNNAKSMKAPMAGRIFGKVGYESKSEK